ncbi:MAG TPA: hypothetical protein DHV33_01765 [Candidatus Moranbacteria bacterium]|nr:hypothetical protein [Candidatus Moranbacteria bacterium]
MNREIIIELKDEHRRIITLLNEVDMNGSQEKVKELILALQGIVVQHLHKEDTLIYPELLHSKNESIIMLGNGFLHSMTEYSVIFVDVTRRILERSNQFDSLLKEDYKKIKDKIKDRIFIEEKALFPVYEGLGEKQL